jgi:tetratricopeptide (TPR) repeat protein
MKTKIISIFIALLTISAFAQKKEIKSAEKAVDNGEYQEAKALLKQVEGTYKNEKESWQSKYLIAKGKAYLGPEDGLKASLEDLKVAADAFKQALALGEDETASQDGIQKLKAAYVNSAVADQKQEKHMMASNKLYEAYQLESDTLYLYYAASSAVAGKEYKKALEHYEDLLDMNYDGSQLQLQAVNVETNELDTFQSELLREAAVRSGSHKDPQDNRTPSRTGEIAKNISLIYIEMDQPEKAIEAMKRAKEENPTDVALLQAEADLYYNLGNMAKYKEIMTSISEMNPNDPVVFYNLGVSAEKLEDFDNARKYYEKAIEIDPTFANAYNNIASLILAEDRVITEEMNSLGMSAADAKKYDELKEKKIQIIKKAIPYLEKTIELSPDNINAMKYLKSIYQIIGDNDKAAAVDKLIKAQE